MRFRSNRRSIMTKEDLERCDEADDDDDNIPPARINLNEALAWVATRNTAFVQVVSGSAVSDLEILAKRAGIKMTFAGSTVEAWHSLQAAISSGRVAATAVLIELPKNYSPEESLPIRGDRIDLPGDVARDLDLVGSPQFSLRPNMLQPPLKWWFKVRVRMDQLQEAFPFPPVSRPVKKRNRRATKLEFAIAFLRGLPGDHYPEGETLDSLAGDISKTGGPLQKQNYKISAKTVGRAADKVWPGWRSKGS